MTDLNQKSNSNIAFNIHASLPDGRNSRVGSKLGVAFWHKNGTGLSIILDAQPIPVDGRIELVAFEPKKQHNFKHHFRH